MMRSFLIRGMIVGVIAALAAFTFGKVTGEPQIDRAIDFEYKTAQAAGEPAEEVVTRDVQSTIGLGTGLLLMGTAMGGIFAIAYGVAYGRVGKLGARGTAAVLAAGAYVTVVLIPALKYPPNPPSVGNADTIGQRTELYFLMIILSVASAVVAIQVGMYLAHRLGQWNASLAGGGVYLALMAALFVLLPVVDEVPAAFPASTLWSFRAASLGTNAVLWTVIGLAFGGLTHRWLVHHAADEIPSAA
jgi:predicted cobalt transporter CbtA